LDGSDWGTIACSIKAALSRDDMTPVSVLDEEQPTPREPVYEPDMRPEDGLPPEYDGPGF